MTIFKSAVAALAGAMAAFIGTASTAHATEPFIAEIRAFAEHACPAHWLPTDGRLLQVADYPALDSVIQDRFGATSRRDFNLPKLTPPETAHGKAETQCISAYGVSPLGRGYAGDEFIGETRLFATAHCPNNWLKTDGSFYAANRFVGLFAVLQHRYGGQGQHFGVPNNPEIIAAGGIPLSECIAANGRWPFN